MKVIRYALVIAASLTVPACNDEIVGPAGPAAPVVAGAWRGTVIFSAALGFYDTPICPEQVVTVQIEQEDRTINGTIQSACLTAQFSGTIRPGRTIDGQVSQTVDGLSYSALLQGNMVESPVSEIRLNPETFSTSSGSLRDAISLALTR